MQGNILVIVPAFNEAENIGRVIPELRKSLNNIDIVVVNDASTDDTESATWTLGTKVLSLPINLGIGGAVQTGLKFAEREGYEIAVQFDGDGQHTAHDIPRLIQPIENREADIVVGSRFLEDRGYRTPIFRRAGMLFSSWITSALLGHRFTDITSGFRAWNRVAIKLFAKDYPMSFPGVESTMYAHYRGLRIKEIPSSFRERLSGPSSINFWRSFYYPFKTLIAVLGVILRRADHPERL